MTVLIVLVNDYACFFHSIEIIYIHQGLNFPLYVIARAWKKDGMMGEAFSLLFFLSLQ